MEPSGVDATTFPPTPLPKGRAVVSPSRQAYGVLSARRKIVLPSGEMAVAYVSDALSGEGSISNDCAAAGFANRTQTSGNRRRCIGKGTD